MKVKLLRFKMKEKTKILKLCLRRLVVSRNGQTFEPTSILERKWKEHRHRSSYLGVCTRRYWSIVFHIQTDTRVLRNCFTQNCNEYGGVLEISVRTYKYTLLWKVNETAAVALCERIFYWRESTHVKENHLFHALATQNDNQRDHFPYFFLLCIAVFHNEWNVPHFSSIRNISFSLHSVIL